MQSQYYYIMLHSVHRRTYIERNASTKLASDSDPLASAVGTTTWLKPLVLHSDGATDLSCSSMKWGRDLHKMCKIDHSKGLSVVAHDTGAEHFTLIRDGSGCQSHEMSRKFVPANLLRTWRVSSCFYIFPGDAAHHKSSSL